MMAATRRLKVPSGPLQEMSDARPLIIRPLWMLNIHERYGADLIGAYSDITDEIARAIALGAKESQHGEDAAIVVRRVGQAELVEDPADIALDGLLAEVEPLADG